MLIKPIGFLRKVTGGGGGGDIARVGTPNFVLDASAATDPNVASYTVISTANVVTVRAAWESSSTGADTITCTLDGNAMTQNRQTKNSRTASAIWALQPSSTGAQNVSLDNSNAYRGFSMLIEEWENVDTANIFDGAGVGAGATGTSNTRSYTTGNDGSMLLGAIAVRQLGFAALGSESVASSDSTIDQQNDTGSDVDKDDGVAYLSRLLGAAGSHDMNISWTTSKRYAYTVCALNKA